MLIDRQLILDSEARMKAANLKPAELDRELGDGPMKMTVEQKQQRYRQLITTTDTETAKIAFERIVGGNDLDSINYLTKGIQAARSICRIQIKDANSNLLGYATGFLIGPGVLITNNHVFEKASDAAKSILDFDYELDIDGNERLPARFRLVPGALFHTNVQLDYSVVGVEPKSIDGAHDLADFGWLSLSGEPGKGDPGEYLTIIQHPAGELKQVCVRENKLLKYFSDRIWYMTDTVGGSSGSPAFNRFWQVTALHHSGVPKKDSHGRWLTKDGKVWDESMDESRIDWIANEGIRISRIVADLKTAKGSHPLVKNALEAVPQAPERLPRIRTLAASAGAGHAGPWVEQNGSTTSLVVPLRIPIDFVRHDSPVNQIASFVPALPQAPAVIIPPNGLPVEAVKIDQSTLATRPGYKPNFLGSGALSVPLPKIPASMKSKIATLIDKPSQSELKYFNYSVVMNKQRKLAFFSAVNIDGGKQQDVGKRTGDKWLSDPRIEERFQLLQKFYGTQKDVEADRTKNPFDRGHLVRRLDATWGSNPEQAKEHGDDSFHFTNCSPQFWAFNQGKRIWLGLEDFTRDVLLANKSKGSVMNGPVFDGPDAEEGELPDASSLSRADPTFGGVKIPKYFWKLMVTARKGKLTAMAFVMSQRDQILAIDRIQESAIFEKLSQAEARVFQVSISDLTKFTKLDFGKLASVDTKEATLDRPRLIESYDDIHLGSLDS